MLGADALIVLHSLKKLAREKQKQEIDVKDHRRSSARPMPSPGLVVWSGTPWTRFRTLWRLVSGLLASAGTIMCAPERLVLYIFHSIST